MLNLVAGGAGFIGGHLVDALTARGERVLIADDLRTGSLRNIDGSVRAGRATFVYVDVERPLSDIRSVFAKAARSQRIGRIFHLASSPSRGHSASLSAAHRRMVVASTQTLVSLSLEHRARLIYVSGEQMLPEIFATGKPTRAPHQPKSDSVDEDAGGQVVASAVDSHGLDAVIVRLPTCYGPRLSNADISLLTALVETAERERPFIIRGDAQRRYALTYVEDAIELILLAAERRSNLPLSIDAGRDERYTAPEVVEMMARVADLPFLVEHAAANADRARESGSAAARSEADVLGYAPRTTLVDGLRTTLTWLRQTASAYV